MVEFPIFCILKPELLGPSSPNLLYSISDQEIGSWGAEIWLHLLLELLICRYTTYLSTRIHEARFGMLFFRADIFNAEVLPPDKHILCNLGISSH